MYKDMVKRKTKSEIKEKDNKKVYLSENKYTVRISNNKGFSSKPFEVKRRQRGDTQEQKGIPGDGK